MSVLTQQTLLITVLIVVVIFRFYATLPSPITNTEVFYHTEKVIELPYIKNNSQIIKLAGNTTVIAPKYPRYDYGDLLEIKGTINSKRVVMQPTIHKVGKQSNFITDQLLRFRRRCESALERNLPQDSVALAEGMLLGTNKEFSQRAEGALKRTGTIHMIVVSGFNITLVATLVLKIAGLLPRKGAMLASGVSVVLFVMLTGAQPPALRAGVMAIIVLIGQYYGRPSTTIRILLLSILAILLYTPQLITSLSFQLSCLATGGITLSAKWIESVIPGSSRLKSELAPTISAQFSVAPLIMNTFGSLSLIAPIANIFVSWLVPYIMITTLTLCLADLISPVISKLVSFVLYPITALFLQTIEVFSKVPFASLENLKINWFVVVGIYAIFAFLLTKIAEEKKYAKLEDNKKEENE